LAEGKHWMVGTVMAVVDRGRVLLVRHTYGERKSLWALPGGSASHDERLDQTAIREVREETGLETEVVDLIGLRTRIGEKGGALFPLFRLRLVAGELKPDGVEVDQAAFFSAEEVTAMGDDQIFPMARNVVLAALAEAHGLPEDEHFPARSDTYRAFLLGVE